MWIAARTEGCVMWIAPSWGSECLASDGICAWIDPARLIFVTPKRGEDLLWTMEEILRSGAVALTIADLPALPSLTQVRRMHLAAETGAKAAGPLPLGLLLTPGQGGAAGVETRWHMRPSHQQGQEHWQLQRLRARTAPPKTWQLQRLQGQAVPQIKTT
jgi:protein ImuA